MSVYRDPGADDRSRMAGGRAAADAAAARRDRQEIDPRNVDDAWWILCHPGDFDAETLRIAKATDAVAEAAVR